MTRALGHQRAQYESPVGKERHRWRHFICLTASVLGRKWSQLCLLPHIVGCFKDQRSPLARLIIVPWRIRNAGVRNGDMWQLRPGAGDDVALVKALLTSDSEEVLQT